MWDFVDAQLKAQVDRMWRAYVRKSVNWFSTRTSAILIGTGAFTLTVQFLFSTAARSTAIKLSQRAVNVLFFLAATSSLATMIATKGFQPDESPAGGDGAGGNTSSSNNGGSSGGAATGGMPGVAYAPDGTTSSHRAMFVTRLLRSSGRGARRVKVVASILIFVAWLYFLWHKQIAYDAIVRRRVVERQRIVSSD